MPHCQYSCLLNCDESVICAMHVFLLGLNSIVILHLVKTLSCHFSKHVEIGNGDKHFSDHNCVYGTDDDDRDFRDDDDCTATMMVKMTLRWICEDCCSVQLAAYQHMSDTHRRGRHGK